jgi:hypothetical protein
MPENRAARLREAGPELYHLEKDPAESNNLIDKYPEKAEAMKNELNRMRNAGHTR